MLVRAVWAAVLAALALQGVTPPQPITVAAAVSLTEALEEIARAYSRGRRRRRSASTSPGRMSSHARSSAARLPTSSSAPTMRRWMSWRRPALSCRARASSSSRISLPSSARRIGSTSCAASSHVRQPRFADWRLAIRRQSQPASTRVDISRRKDCGCPMSRGLYRRPNVSAALTAVETGAVDAAIVYVTDLAAAADGGAGVDRPDCRRSAHRVSRRAGRHFAKPRSAALSGVPAAVPTRTAIFTATSSSLPKRGQAPV